MPDNPTDTTLAAALREVIYVGDSTTFGLLCAVVEAAERRRVANLKLESLNGVDDDEAFAAAWEQRHQGFIDTDAALAALEAHLTGGRDV